MTQLQLGENLDSLHLLFYIKFIQMVMEAKKVERFHFAIADLTESKGHKFVAAFFRIHVRIYLGFLVILLILGELIL